jgi:LDH2 family malate/lactate/ureidoglycolate dehydrogenase
LPVKAAIEPLSADDREMVKHRPSHRAGARFPLSTSTNQEHCTQMALKTIPVADLKELCRAVLQQCGLSDADARLTADVLVTTDTYGVYTHGTKCLAGYVARLKAGGLKSDAAPTVTREGPGWAIVDGHAAIAMVTSVFAMNAAIAKARQTGIAYVGVHNSCHFGAAGYYVNLAARSEMIGLAMANDTPSMVTPGARKPVLGTNPFSYAVPAGRENPIFLDIASSAAAIGKIRIAKALGQRVPDSWLVDADGLPTGDASAYPHAAAPAPFAGHKGYGIALMIEVLAGLLADGGIRWDVTSWIEGDIATPTNHGGAFLAIDIGQIVPLATFKRRIDEMIGDIRKTPPAKGVDRVRLPGEIEWDKRRAALADGIPLPEDVRINLQTAAAAVGLPADWLMQ